MKNYLPDVQPSRYSIWEWSPRGLEAGGVALD